MIVDKWGGSWGVSWGLSWGGGPVLTDTDAIQLPVDCYVPGLDPVKDRYREYNIRPMALNSRGSTNRSAVNRVRGGRPSFTTTSSRKGYD